MHSVRRLQLLLIGALFSFAVVAACSDAKPRPQVVEEPEASVESGAPAVVDAGPDASCTLAHSFGSASCNACVAQTCCASLEPCYADDTCRALADCIIACISTPDAGGCASECSATIPDEKDLWRKLESCVYFNPPCEDQCAVTQ